MYYSRKSTWNTSNGRTIMSFTHCKFLSHMVIIYLNAIIIINCRNSFCKLCQKLHNASEPVKTIEDAHEWWYKRSDGTSTCTDGQDREYFKTVKHKLT